VSQPNGFRLSPQQARLWSLLSEGHAGPLRARCVLTLEGALDVRRLEHALRDVLSRHEILRTTYHALPGTSSAVQVPGEVPAVVLEVLEWKDASGAERQARLEALLAQAAPSPEGLVPFRLVTLDLQRHALVVDLPALSADRPTLVNLAKELGRACTGQLEEPSVQYADVAELFHQVLEAEDSGTGRDYWKDVAPADAAPASRPTGRSGQVTRVLAPETASSLEATAGRLGVPVAALVLAGWQLLLSRLTERTEWLVAVRQEGRTYEGLDEALGLFERYVPLRFEARERTRFSDLAADVARAMKEATEWQDYFDASRSPSRFGFEEVVRPEELRAGALTLRLSRVESRTERFELALALVRGQGPLALELSHEAGTYAPGQASRLLERLETLLREAAAAPERAPAGLPWVGPEELRRLEGFHQTHRPYDTDGTLHERFDAVARRMPEAMAVALEERSLTFAELAARSNQLAWHLRSLGVGPGVCVGLCLERSVEQFVALLGILKAGGAFVPMDPTYPRERLVSMLEQAGATLVVTRSTLGTSLPEGLVRRVDLDTGAEALTRLPATAPPVTVHPEDLAYVLFTSGSTGKPKGVMIQHRSVLNLAATLRDVVYEGRGPGLRVSVNAPLVFDASVKQWAQLLNGYSLVIIPEEVRPDAVRMREYVQRHALDVLDCTPSLLVPMLAQGLGQEPDFSPTLVLVGGEAIDARLWAGLVQRPRTRFVNMYGPTECTVNATSCPILSHMEPSLGRPLGNVRIHVLDAGLRPLPLGVPGELYIGGAGLARGYVGRPDLTAERFVPDPFGEPGARLYRTGDLGRYRDDGRLEFLGRADHQVKLRGYRIELGEIESLILKHPEVGETVVVLRELQPGESHLVAYFVPRRGLPAGSEAVGQELATQLRSFLRELLPEYMVPWALVPLPKLPLNRNGKLDRAALPDPRTARQEAAPYEAPTTELEQKLVAIWQEVLKVDKVGLHSNFFDLGGHSLLMVQVHEKLSAVLGRRLSMVELFQHPTVASLVRFLGQEQSGGSNAPATKRGMDERAQKQRQAMQQQALLIKAGRGKR
jgi:amino acid adenylation domain-containing protein